MENIFIVSNVIEGRRVIQGVFKDQVMADAFAKLFDAPTVDKEYLYNEFPKVYRYICTLDLEKNEIVEVTACTPSVNPVLLVLKDKFIHAVGETKAEAQYNAESYRNKLSSQKSSD